MRYSQNNEEDLICQHFAGKTGSFLDIGAYDGITFSNTRRLAELGWKGVCVEASPVNFCTLLKNSANLPDVVLVNAAVTAAPAAGLCQWYDSNGDGVSTASMAHKARWEAGSAIRFTPFWLTHLPVAHLFQQFGHAFDFISLDVEGTNLQVFECLPFESLVNLKMLCVEHDNHVAEMEARLQPLQFKRIALNPENAVFIR